MPEDNENTIRTARCSDWKTEPMPEQHETFLLTRSFNDEEMAVLRRGNIPQAMEDKWFWYMEDKTLWAHRSWTGYCIYRIDFKKDNNHVVTVNRDPEVIRPLDRPYSATGGIAVLKGNIAPDTAVVKRSAVLPEMICANLKTGIRAMNAQLPGFAMPDAVLTGPETRSSSPVRMLRSASGEAEDLAGLYPVGEGAGFAGGIVSAAIDGITAARRVLGC